MAAARTTAARRPRRVQPLVDIEKQFHAFLYNWSVATKAGKERDKARDRIKTWFGSGGDSGHEIGVNENGSQILEFPEPLEINGHKFTGLENRRTVTSELDPDLIDEWLESLPVDKRLEISKRIMKRVVEYVLDPNEIFKLNQEGIIDDDILDSLYATDVKFSLNVVKD